LTPTPSILFAEDEENLLQIIKLNLEMENYFVKAVTNGNDALAEAKKNGYDLLILDVMMPGMNGFDVCKEFRKNNTETPVLFLTARGSGDDRVTGLKIGADDYIVKPFNLEELLLRVKILLSRIKKAQNVTEVFSFGEYKIDFKTYEIFESETKITELGNREIQLLKLLIDRQNQVVSREEILDKIWGEETFPTSRTIDNYILIFRKYFEKNPREPRYFHSVRGVGYKFTP
jgi:two-component system alkaline phosphatase synthesis response regulator PhoP